MKRPLSPLLLPCILVFSSFLFPAVSLPLPLPSTQIQPIFVPPSSRAPSPIGNNPAKCSPTSLFFCCFLDVGEVRGTVAGEVEVGSGGGGSGEELDELGRGGAGEVTLVVGGGGGLGGERSGSSGEERRRRRRQQRRGRVGKEAAKEWAEMGRRGEGG